VEASKPSATIFEAACAAAGEVPGPGIIMVGDELEA
jgi:ribonucleotide monophosphatase NagD (HAD superfamily)